MLLIYSPAILDRLRFKTIQFYFKHCQTTSPIYSFEQFESYFSRNSLLGIQRISFYSHYRMLRLEAHFLLDKFVESAFNQCATKVLPSDSKSFIVEKATLKETVFEFRSNCHHRNAKQLTWKASERSFRVTQH